MMCLTPLRPSTASGMSLVTGCAVMLTLHDLAHSNAVTNCFDRRSNSSLTGHAGVVSSRVNVTSPASDTRRSLTNPQLTMSSPKSGSMTLRRAFRTSASLLPSGADVMDGDDDGVKGASPTPGTVSSTNWPAAKTIGSAGRMEKVLIVGVSSTTPSISAGIGM